MVSFFENGMDSDCNSVNGKLKKLVLKHRIGLQLRYIYDKFKFGIYRRLGIYENYKTIK